VLGLLLDSSKLFIITLIKNTKICSFSRGLFEIGKIYELLNCTASVWGGGRGYFKTLLTHNVQQWTDFAIS
jgi:hypothetical protein